MTSRSSPYDENTDDEDFMTSSSRRNDVACSRRRDGQSNPSTIMPEKVASSVYEEDTDNEEWMVSPEKEGEQQTCTSSHQRSASIQTCVAIARDDSSSMNSSDGQAAIYEQKEEAIRGGWPDSEES